MENQASADQPAQVVAESSNAPAAPVVSAPQASSTGRDVNKEIEAAAAKGDFATITKLTKELGNEIATFIDTSPKTKPASADNGTDEAAPVEATEDASADKGEGTEATTEASATDDANKEGIESDGAKVTSEEDGDASEFRGKQFRLGKDANGNPIRVRAQDPIEQRAYEIRAATGLHIREALEIADRELNGGKSAATTAPDTTATTAAKAPPVDTSKDLPAIDPALPQTIEQADAKLAELEEARWKGMQDYDNDAIVAAEKAIKSLTKHTAALQTRAAATAQQAQREYDAAFAASNAKALDLYDFTTRPDSPEMQRLKEIDETWRLTGDPAYYDADKPRVLAQIVAKEFRIAPKSKLAPRAPAAAATPSSASPRTAVPNLASGSARTSAPPMREAQQEAFAKSIPKTTHQLEEFIRKLAAGGA